MSGSEYSRKQNLLNK